ncbi:hypothetical protein A9Q84_07175 [Halobacteriovorax marinus]|uniref:HD-GYP domain-containing protein n=1 Tax=Halobacteriovorax marinus TaxID=97084 RepID=A0A1Y5F5G8_9BACT|nr:hypothetical protein A9Q84_07175 [Halobacteriovorax marinus]
MNKFDYSSLETISFSELKDMQISYGDLYWKKANGKFVKVLICGDQVDFSKLAKFEKVTPHLFIHSVCNKSFVKKGVEIISRLLSSIDEIERLRLRDQFILHLGPVFWKGDEQDSILSLVLIFQNSLYDIQNSFEEEMESNAFLYHKRSVLSSTLITLFAMASGYTHGDFLKDLFNVCHFFDYSLSKGELSVEEPKHIEQSRKLFIESKFYIPKNKNLSKLIEFHHELLNESGAFIGSNLEEIGDLERIVIWIENILPFVIEEFSSEDGQGYLNKILNESKNQETFVDSSLRKRLIAAFNMEEVELEQTA